MKKIILLSTCLFLFTIIGVKAQDIDLNGETIRNTVTGIDGQFVVANDDADNNLKLKIDRTGEVNWYLDKQLFFIRDGNFEAFPGVFTGYDFIHIDGATGRIGFNILSDDSYGELPLTSSIHLNGSIATRVRSLNGSGSYVLKQDDHTVIITLNANNVNMDLPPVAEAAGRNYRIKRDFNSGANADLVISASAGEFIDGSPTYTVSKTLGVVELVCDGTQWWIMSAGDQFVFSTPVIGATLNSEEVVGISFTSSGESITLNLPTAADYNGKRYEIKRNVDGVTFGGQASHLFIKPTGSDKLDDIDSSSSGYDMENDFEAVTVQSNGILWLIVNSHNH